MAAPMTVTTNAARTARTERTAHRVGFAADGGRQYGAVSEHSARADERRLGRADGRHDRAPGRVSPIQPLRPPGVGRPPGGVRAAGGDPRHCRPRPVLHLRGAHHGQLHPERRVGRVPLARRHFHSPRIVALVAGVAAPRPRALTLYSETDRPEQRERAWPILVTY